MSDIFGAAVKNKGDGIIRNNQFFKSYGQTEVVMKSYSPPAFALKYGHAVNVLRGIGLFMSLYGYLQMEFDIRSTKDGHVGSGSVR